MTLLLGNSVIDGINLGKVKLNVDAATFENLAATGVGVVVRDDMGEYGALSWVRELGLQNIEVELDILSVVKAIDKLEDNSTSCGFIAACLNIISSFIWCIVSYIPRNVNIVAHKIARASCSYSSPHTWVEPPIFVDDLLTSTCSSCLQNNTS
ncbi:hypothetical protein OROMI_012337 [Orobanche minor]